jgi:hypothetical protein
LVRQHTANVLSLQNIMARNIGARFSAKRIDELTPAELERLLPEAEQRLAVTSSLVLLHCLGQQSKRLEKAVTKRLQHTPAYQQLLRVEGIGPILAQTLGLETGAMRRFPTVGTGAFGDSYAFRSRCRWRSNTRSKVPLYLAQRSANI